MKTAVITLASGLIVALLNALPVSAQTRAGPGGLPAHFGIGIEAGLGDTWLPQSGIAWDFRWQYLTGGVNTSHGWETWNANGTFALNYANESAQHGYLPMFPYYELLQSNATCSGCNENQKDITNLNTPAVMAAYYQNFALLMKRLGPRSYDGVTGFGKTVLINVEPDFSGGYAVQAVNNGACFGFCTGRGNDPALLQASVASSGFADVASFPNTYLGFTQALAHLRDLYAPNVLLGYDVSDWATGEDIGVDHSPTVDAGLLGSEVGAFLSKTGPHELLWNDPLDRDAGQYRALFNQDRWWDRLNVAFPNFARWEQYLHATLVADNNKPMLLWQVPLGNQYFQTDNNTDGHFQDNRAEYIFGHIPELMQNGVVAALFGAGNAGSTTNADTKGDGITNPPSICTIDGFSSGQICNNHLSTVADDDGGYVRMAAQAYYQNPVPLPGAPTPTPTPTPAPTPAPQPVVLTVTLTQFSADASEVSPGDQVSLSVHMSINQNAPALIDYELWDAQNQKLWQSWHDNQPLQAATDNSDSAVFTVPDDLSAGEYHWVIGVFSAGWGTMYAWNDQAGTLTVD